MTFAQLESELGTGAEAMAGAPRGAYRTRPQLMRGNLGERLATEALATMGHQILGYKPDISGTNLIQDSYSGAMWRSFGHF
jgi:hypothetical protein